MHGCTKILHRTLCYFSSLLLPKKHTQHRNSFPCEFLGIFANQRGGVGGVVKFIRLSDEIDMQSSGKRRISTILSLSFYQLNFLPRFFFLHIIIRRLISWPNLIELPFKSVVDMEDEVINTKPINFVSRSS